MYRCPTIAGASSSPIRSRTAPSGSATTSARPSGTWSRASIATPCAASSSLRATPSPRASSSSVCSASPHRRSMTCAISSRSTSRKAVTSGRWCICFTATSAAMAVRKRRSCFSAAAATPTSRGSWAPSTRPSTTGSTSSCSRCSRTATASISCWPSPSPASIRCPAPLASC